METIFILRFSIVLQATCYMQTKSTVYRINIPDKRMF
ncbi:hypothetical protein BX611_3007 [Lutibacter oceani]|uniref:Uncharacterized protein n=1 Tax=Lutibacter oceani TaxID=1853311 RepID=A0A3D9RPP4_9FLAO|nr:hypothetical protein BX611_3007 [Lutibacter oceani]